MHCATPDLSRTHRAPVPCAHNVVACGALASCSVARAVRGPSFVPHREGDGKCHKREHEEHRVRFPFSVFRFRSSVSVSNRGQRAREESLPDASPRRKMRATACSRATSSQSKANARKTRTFLGAFNAHRGAWHVATACPPRRLGVARAGDPAARERTVHRASRPMRERQGARSTPLGPCRCARTPATAHREARSYPSRARCRGPMERASGE